MRCLGGQEPVEYLRADVITKLQQASRGDNFDGLATVSFAANALEPGCDYDFELSLLGRWGVENTEAMVLHKQVQPAPGLQIIGTK